MRALISPSGMCQEQSTKLRRKVPHCLRELCLCWEDVGQESEAILAEWREPSMAAKA